MCVEKYQEEIYDVKVGRDVRWLITQIIHYDTRVILGERQYGLQKFIENTRSILRFGNVSLLHSDQD